MTARTTRRFGRWVRDSSSQVNHVLTTPARGLARGAQATARVTELYACRIGRIEVPLPNGQSLIMEARPHDGVANRLWWHGWNGYEPEMSGLWFRMAARSSCILDVGANAGYYSLLAAHANSRAQIFAFEPVPANYAALEVNVVANASRISSIPMAVADRVGKVSIAVDSRVSVDALATLIEDSPGRQVTDPGIEVVPCAVTTIDTFAEERRLPAVDLIKIDVERAEPFVLNGMRGVLERSRPTIFIEILTDRGAAAAEKTATEHCYNRFVLTEHGPIPIDRVRAFGEQRPGAPLRNQLLTTLSVDQVMTLGAPDGRADREAADEG